ncbi:MAG: hypothetical protein OWV35_07620, partial [Firmicutes bacterium]|nr:hypothetical protein [Bacillota bacterium]
MAGLRLALAGLLGAAAVSCPWWLAARAGAPRPVRLAGVSTGMAARLARAAAGGQVLSVAPTARNGRTVFQARVRSPDGRVWTVEVDGEDGRVEKQPWEPSPAGSSPAGTRPANPAPVSGRPRRTSAP